MAQYNFTRQIRKVFEQNKREFIRAEVTALNRSGKSAFSNTSREVRKEYRVSASGLKKAVRFRRANKNKLKYTMVFNNYGIPLHKFANKQTSRGVRATQRKGKATLYKGTFIATMPSGHTGIFGRTSRARAKKTKSGKWHALPIKELYGLSVGRLFKGTNFVYVMGPVSYTHLTLPTTPYV